MVYSRASGSLLHPPGARGEKTRTGEQPPGGGCGRGPGARRGRVDFIPSQPTPTPGR